MGQMPRPSSLAALLTLLLTIALPHASATQPPSLYIAANFRSNEATIPGFVREIVRLASHFPSVHVTVYESDSSDATPHLLHIARRTFNGVSITHNITTNGALVRGRRSRIDFLADARNELLKPLRDMAPQRVFDYVVFLNDVFFVAEDVLKLLAVGADVSCGTDFIPIGEANQIYRPTVDDKYPIFYDAWVARSLEGLPLRAMPPYVPPMSVVSALNRVVAMNLAFPDYTRVANMLELPVPPQPEIVQLQCCWNGVVAVRAAPFYAGLSFRSNLPGECAGSECSHFCADMWMLNYTRFTMHHGVRVAYEEETWARAKQLDLGYLPTQFPFQFNDTRPSTVLCCGEHRIVRQPVYFRQDNESTYAFVYRVYIALTEEPPSEDLLELLSEFVGASPAIATDALRVMLSDEPRAPCIMQPLVSVVDRVCLADAQRAIPRTLTQIGATDAREALIPHAATWKALHPDHEYVFVDVDAEHWAGVPGDVVTAFRRALAGGHTALAADIARYAVLFYRGGIVADLDTTTSDCLSCVLTSVDALVAIYAAGESASLSASRPIAMAATPRHPTVLEWLNAAVQQANNFVATGGKDADFLATTPLCRKLFVDARRLNVPVLIRGHGARTNHVLDATVAV